MKRLCLLLFSCYLLASCINTRPTPQTLLFPPEKINKTGFTFMPPSEKGWYIAESTPIKMSLAKRGNAPDETYAIVVTLLVLPEFKSDDDFLKYVKQDSDKSISNARFKDNKIKASLRSTKNGNCVSFSSISNDTQAAKASGNKKPMIMETIGLFCRHTTSQRIGVMTGYSHRYYAGQEDNELSIKADVLSNGLNLIELSYTAVDEIGGMADQKKDYIEANKLYRSALDLALAQNASTSEISRLTYNLGRVTGFTCDYKKSESLLIEALKLEEQVSGKNGGYVTLRLFELARLYIDQEQYEKAIPYLERAIPLVENIGVEKSDPIGYALVLEDYSIALKETGNTDKYKQIITKIRNLRSNNSGKKAHFIPIRYKEECEIYRHNQTSHNKSLNQDGANKAPPS